MDLVTAAELGTVAIGRMVRDGVVEHLAPGFAVPLDLPVTMADRAACVADATPRHTVVSGLSAVWIVRGGARPLTLTLVGQRGLHRAPIAAQPLGWRVLFHSGPAAQQPSRLMCGVRVTSLERAVADALRWDDLASAFPACVSALHSGDVNERTVTAMIFGSEARGPGTARAISAWKALLSARP